MPATTAPRIMARHATANTPAPLRASPASTYWAKRRAYLRTRLPHPTNTKETVRLLRRLIAEQPQPDGQCDGTWWCCGNPYASYHAAMTHAGIQRKRRGAN